MHGVFESDFLECLVPPEYTLFYGGLPQLREGIVDVVHDWFLRFYQFAPFPCVYVFGFEPPAVGYAVKVDFVFLGGDVLFHGEEDTHAGVGYAGFHFVFRQ